MTQQAPLIAMSARIRTSPFFQATLRYGCKMFTTYNHMYMPVHYGDPVEDYWNLVNHVTLWDVAVERQVEITGPDAAAFVQYLTPRNLSKCKVGQCKYVILVDENGGMLNDPVLLKLGENHFWLSLADNDILLWAKGIAAHTDFDVNITEPDVSPLQLQGPKAADVMRDLVGDWIDSLRYFRFKEYEIDGIPVVISRTGWSNEKGYEIFLRDGSRGDELWELIMAAGQPYQIAPAAPSAIKRIEAGLLSYFTDMSLTENPFEMGLGKYIDLEQEAEFMGKAALKEIASRPLVRKLVGLEIIDAKPIGTNAYWWDVSYQGEKVGEMTNNVYSPRLEKNIALAIVKSECSEIDTPLTLHTPNGTRLCKVRDLPFEASKVNS